MLKAKVASTLLKREDKKWKGWSELLKFLRGYVGTTALLIIFFRGNYILAHGALAIMLIWLCFTLYKRRVKPIVLAGATRLDTIAKFSALALNVVPWFFALHFFLTHRHVPI